MTTQTAAKVMLNAGSLKVGQVNQDKLNQAIDAAFTGVYNLSTAVDAAQQIRFCYEVNRALNAVGAKVKLPLKNSCSIDCAALLNINFSDAERAAYDRAGEVLAAL